MIIRGWASLYNIKDNSGDTVLPGAFDKTIRLLKKNKRQVPIFLEHNKFEPIGHTLRIELRDKGLYMIAELYLDDRQAVKNMVNVRALHSLSIGYVAKDTVCGDGVRDIKQLELLEISIVHNPMLKEAIITEVKEGGLNYE